MISIMYLLDRDRGASLPSRLVGEMAVTDDVKHLGYHSYRVYMRTAVGGAAEVIRPSCG